MIWSDHTIADRLDEIVGYPDDIDPVQIQPASLDVRIAPNLYDQIKEQEVDGAGDDGKLHLTPGKPYLGNTLEYVSLPNDVGSFMTGRSSIGRRNIVIHQTAGWIDPGFEGQLTFELLNFGDEPTSLEVGERVAQLIFFGTDRPSSGYDGQYQGQVGIVNDRSKDGPDHD